MLQTHGHFHNIFSFYIQVMIEFSENLAVRYEGSQAVGHKALYRLSVREGEIPYFNGGLAVREFTYNNDLTMAVRRVLSDFDVEVNVSGDRVSVGDIVITVPGGLSA